MIPTMQEQMETIKETTKTIRKCNECGATMIEGFVSEHAHATYYYCDKPCLFKHYTTFAYWTQWETIYEED